MNIKAYVFLLVIVTAAIIFKDDRILIAKRGDKWEFPGGKLEENESLEECIKREIKEELNIEISDIKNFGVEKENNIELHVFTANFKKGRIKLNFHKEIKWVDANEILNYDFLDLDKKVAQKIAKRI